jgi:hypothetical protein
VVIAGPRVSLLLPRGEYVVGVGCRRGITKEAVTAALHTAFQEAGIDSGTVLVYATTDKKKGKRDCGMRSRTSAEIWFFWIVRRLMQRKPFPPPGHAISASGEWQNRLPSLSPGIMN